MGVIGVKTQYIEHAFKQVLTGLTGVCKGDSDKSAELATAHQTKLRADVLLIKIPPALPSRNGGHVFNFVVGRPESCYVTQG